MNCPNCGAVVAPGSLYCPSCRNAIDQPWPQSAKAEQPQNYRQDFAPKQSWQQSAQTGAQLPEPSRTAQTGLTAQSSYPRYTSALPDFAPRQSQQGYSGQEYRQNSYSAQSYTQPGSFGQETFQPQASAADSFNAGIFTPPGQTLTSYLQQNYSQQTQPVNSYTQQAQAANPYAQQAQPATGYTQQMQAANPYAQQAQPATGYTQQMQAVNPYAQQAQPATGYTQQMQAVNPYAQQAQPATGYTQQMQAVNPYAQQAQPANGYTQQMQAVNPYAQQAQPANGYTQQMQAVNSYAQQSYQQGYPQAQPTAQSYTYQPPQHSNPVMAMVTELPRLFLGSFTAPGQVLRTLVERGDVITGPITLAVALVVVFLGGMAAMRGVVSVLFSLITTLTGISLANSTSALRQGVNYIAGQIAPAVGGIAVLCQVIAIIVPVAVILGYLYLVHRQPPNWLMALEMATVTTIPTIAVALLSMLGSMISPLLAVVVMILGVVIAYLQLSNMLSLLLGGTDNDQLRVKMICFPVALLLTLGLIYLLGGNLLGGVFQHMISLLGNMGAMV